MLRKYNFVIFTVIFGILFGLVFFTGYTQKDTNTKTGKIQTEPTFSESSPAASLNLDKCSNSNCGTK